MKISVVVPTFNRNEQLSQVLDYLLVSDVEGFEAIEIIVVDDGSPEPARGIVESKNAEAPFELRYVRQENAGPAAARNNGFARAGHEVVLFIDDDILVTPDMVKQHYRAHIEKPGSVVFGRSPYAIPEKVTTQYSYLKNLADEYTDEIILDNLESRFVRVDIGASGNISVEKSLFPDGEMYGSGLEVPVSEEYALALRLQKEGIPIYFATHIHGWHLQPATIEDSCKQNYKYGLGIAEIVIKMPEITELEQLRNIFAHNRRESTGGGVKGRAVRILKRIGGKRPMRDAMLRMVMLADKLMIPRGVLFPLFRMVVGTYFSAGVQDGEKRFGNGAN